MHYRSILRAFLVLILIFALAGCQTPKASNPIPPPDNSTTSLLQPGDKVTVAFASSPELNQSQTIRADGMLSLLMVGEVKAAGRTPAGLRATLMQLYKPKLQNVDLSVAVDGASPAVYVSGAVNDGGKIQLNRSLTVLEAIMEAGGFARGLADPKHVQVIRKVKGKHETFIVNLAPALAGKPTQAVYVQPYDVIVVPERWL